MPDYGHDLIFGTFLTPDAAAPERVVALAQLTDAAGLDLVTVQDHPYQPRFLEMWTLLSYLAAATQAVRLVPNVANLPLRPPAVLARAAASLDLLSNGRVELGLGTGAFWDAIAANGGPRRSPGEAVEALEEAVAVMRGLWAADGAVTVDGAHYSVVGAKAGPAPAHDIGIWVGAYKPRMLGLVGRLADGWLPSLGYVQPDELAGMNERIDEAADAAGRAPTDVRRLLNINGRFTPRGTGFLAGPAEQWAEDLAGLTLADGISGFVLGGDDADDVRRFAEEVVPAVRELVGAERERAQQPAAGTPVEVAPSVTTAATTAATTLSGPGVVGGQATSWPAGLAVTPTPDDGTRRSAVRPWDEASRPVVVPADPDRTYTAHEQASGRHLVDVHDHLRSELRQIRSLVEQVLGGTLDAGAARSAVNAMTMRQNSWTVGAYCASYCRVVTIHHTLEDESVFPHLRRAEPRLGAVLDRLAQEHHVIHGVLDQVDRALVAFVSPDDDGRALSDAVDLLSDTLLSHLSYEEHQLVEPLARHGMY